MPSVTPFTTVVSGVYSLKNGMAYCGNGLVWGVGKLPSGTESKG